jgi:predicted ester cyclase
MHEPALNLDGVVLSPQKEVVREFYKEMWDHAGRRSPEHNQFAGYMDWVTTAFGNYTADMLVLVEEGNRVSGKMRFHGYHRQEMFGIAPSGCHVWWIGMPIFTFESGKVRDLYVLGDIYGLSSACVQPSLATLGSISDHLTR